MLEKENRYLTVGHGEEFMLISAWKMEWKH
jgi:hypothetical protein